MSHRVTTRLRAHVQHALAAAAVPLVLLSILLGPRALEAQLPVVGDGGPGPVKAAHLTAELVSLGPAIAPGGMQKIGLVLTIEEHWHVYWRNAGDAGEPPQVKWTTPKEITVGPMQFAVPSQLPYGPDTEPAMDFGYEDVAAFPFTLTAAKNAKPGPVHLDAQVSWLVCSAQTCLPGKAHLGIDLKVQPGATLGPLVGALGEAVKAIPGPLPPEMKVTAAGGKKALQLTLTTSESPEQLSDVSFFPSDQDVIVNAADQPVEFVPGGLTVGLERSPAATELPKRLRGLLKLSDKQAYEIDVPVVAGEVVLPTPGPRVAPAPQVSTGQPVGEAAGGVVQVTLMLGLALLGGAILNLMPCVFPVLFLKGLALVQSSGDERKKMRAHGMVYTLGILVSFWVIVGVLLVLRAGGKQAGWGFQLQSPVFIALLGSLLFFFALSLAGQFDLGLSLTSAGDSLTRKEGFAGSFFTGVLATVVATPCTAPLMGTAIGFALAQQAGITFAIFTALGLGLALPYLLLTLQPAWTRLLPRPGAWMETLKQLTAVPLFATAIWLVWVYGQLFASDTGAGVDHVARLLTCFLVLAIAGWALGKWPNKTASAVAAVLLCIGALAIPLTEPKAETLVWQPYSQATLEQARAAGRPVFIDFTAAWCLSCKVNEKAVLQSEDVDRQLLDHKFVLLRADWTRYDPAITEQLKSVGRSGVPTYVLYPASAGSAADVLPELLTKSLVLDAIKRDAK
jgi:thiol:disulfide interchange protein DsbD